MGITPIAPLPHTQESHPLRTIDLPGDFLGYPMTQQSNTFFGKMETRLALGRPN
jgi:hypothetical protein